MTCCWLDILEVAGESGDADKTQKAAAATALPASDSDFLSGDSEDESNSLVSCQRIWTVLPSTLHCTTKLLLQALELVMQPSLMIHLPQLQHFTCRCNFV